MARLKKAMQDPNPKGKRKAAAARLDEVKPGHCMKPGCGSKIEKWKAGCGWKLCTTCLLECRKSGKPVPLVNGDKFIPRNVGKAFKSMIKAGCSDIPSKESIKEMSKAYKIEKRNIEKTVPDLSEDEGNGHSNSKDSRYVKFTRKTRRMIANLKGNARKD